MFGIGRRGVWNLAIATRKTGGRGQHAFDERVAARLSLSLSKGALQPAHCGESLPLVPAVMHRTNRAAELFGFFVTGHVLRNFRQL